MPGSSDDPMRVQVVFVQDKFFLGGIEVLELKLVEELSRRGLAPVIASRWTETLDAAGAGYARFVHRGYPDFLSRIADLVPDGAGKVILVSLHPTAAIASELAGRIVRRRCGEGVSIHHFHWVSHSRAFFFSRNTLVNRLFERVFRLLPVGSTCFMNEAARVAHQTFWHRSLEDYPVLRIVGREPTARHAGARASGTGGRPELRIVSVGRLVAFKSYNMHAARITRQLRDAGIDASWDIWGYGPDEGAIASSAKEHGVADHVRLRGPLPHAEFDRTVSACDIFVGMGTAVLEAAKTGMPACLAVEGRADACYGQLHEAPADSVGDRVEGVPERKLYEVLSGFAALGAKERARVGEQDALAARQRESTLDEFAAAILAAEPITRAGLAGWAPLSVGKAYLTAKHRKLERAGG